MASVFYGVSYLDGLSAREQILDCVAQDRALHLRGENVNIYWDYRDTVIEKEFDPTSQVAILSNKLYDDARLMIRDADLYRAIAVKLPRAHAFTIPFTMRSLIALCIISIIFMTGLYLFIRYQSRILAPRIPTKIQESLVDIIAEDMREKIPTVCRTRQKAALSQMAQRMGRENGLKNMRVLIDPDPQVNAFALPANTLVFNAGMLKDIKTEEELAGVFAHEMGHLRKYHPQQKFINSVGVGLLAALTIGTTDMGSLSKIAVMFDDITYSKKMENEADEEAILIMKKSGINPEGIAEFFRRMEKEEGKKSASEKMLTEYLSTHPSTQSRIEKFAAVKKGKRAPYLTQTEWRALKQDCDTKAKKN